MTSRRSILLALASPAVLAACGASTGSADRARDIERRILAPCCWRQTLEDHESELAHALRAEIEHRVAAGEASGAIEDDLVRRYGDKVRAMPRTWDPRPLLGVAVASVLGLGGLAVVRFMRRRRAVPAVSTPAVDPRDSDYEERLDDELVAVD